MDKLFKSRVDVNTARQVFLDIVSPLKGIESIPVEVADNRILASEVCSEQNVPHYKRSAMDGFAVRAEDTLSASPVSPIILKLTEEVIQNTCKRVHTGSAMPAGADAVVMLEDSRLMNGAVEITAQVHPNKHVGEIGEDVMAGEMLFEPGHQLRPGDLAVLGSIGIRDIEVYHRPLIAIIPTGEEVMPRGTVLNPGEIWETNSLMTASYVRKFGAVPRISDIVIDNYELLRQAILAGLDADMLIISGGTSVGERDLVPSVIAEIGELLVHGVAISPGKPTALGIVNQKPVLCMPGYPVAGLVALLVFGKDAIQKLGHIPKIPEIIKRLPLKDKITSRQDYQTYVRVRIADNMVEPLMTSGAGILSSVAKADGYVVVPPNIEGYGAGTEVDIISF
ncbi:MAG TPA: molybdopterin molybdotransferase MoeA [Candidatus Nanoarchaeia archaeon]|nr:molybdopterin molybdotransferase MoeA [Candidatus Nanoarchaeia archaeon]